MRLRNFTKNLLTLFIIELKLHIKKSCKYQLWKCQCNFEMAWLYCACVQCLASVLQIEIVFCCYNCLDLPWEKFFQVWVTFFPSSWEQEYCVEKRLCKFEAVGREFVTFSRHYSCLRELGKQVTNTWKKLWAWYKSRQL